MKEFTKHHLIVAQIKTWFAKKQFAHVSLSEKINFIGHSHDDSFVRTELALTSPLENFSHIEVWVTNEGAIGFVMGHPQNPGTLICGHQPVHITSDMVLELLDVLSSGACALKKSWLHLFGFKKYCLLMTFDDLNKIKHYNYSMDYSYATHYISPCEELPAGGNVLALSKWR